MNPRNDHEKETEMTTTTIAPGVTQLPHRCWVLIDRATGKPYEAEEITHFDTVEEARESLAAALEVRPDAEPDLLGTPCWTATPACGDTFEADGMLLHYPSAEELQKALDDCGWTVVDGRLCCEECGEACGS